MCGIVGFWMKNSIDPKNGGEILKNITDLLSHRGPDDEGYYIDEKFNIYLGHRRLSIIDLSPSGHQPMISHSKRYVSVYNGEVYNYPELKKELEDGYNVKFRGTSDTEVLLSGFDIWGVIDTIKKANGMFAIALWDKKEKKLYLIRDRVGIKPLYWGIQKGTLFFASELKSIRKNPLFHPEIDLNSLTLFFRHNYIPTPYTIYKGIQKLTPGHILIIDKNFNVEDYAYWNFTHIAEQGVSSPLENPEDEILSQLEELLKDAVSRRMISDVPLGAFLSGGIDSSLVVSLMQSVSTQPVKTFTIGFYEEGFNEAKYANKVAGHLGTSHTELYVTPKEAQDFIPEIPFFYDEPFSDSSQIPTYLVSRLTRNYVTVSLSGDGGDELFGGYNRYFWAEDIYNTSRKIPYFLRRGVSHFIRMLPPSFWDRIFKLLNLVIPEKYRFTLPGDKLYKLSNILKYKYPKELYHDLVSHFKAPEKFVIRGEEPITTLTSNNPEIRDFTLLMMYYDFLTYLPDDILTKVDRASMAVSLEARVPILDHRVVEFAWKIPKKYKVNAKKGKLILRKILYKYVPKELIERPKMGFGIPLGEWLRTSLKDWAWELINPDRLKREGILDPQTALTLWQEHQSGRRDWVYLLWDILMFQAWKEKWMN